MTKRGVCRRYIYCYDVIDLRTGELATEAYVGKTSSNPRYRDAQHRAGKVWAHQIEGSMQILWQGDCGRVTLWFLEVFYILVKRPLFNVEWNRRNPHRIPPWEAKALYGRGAR